MQDRIVPTDPDLVAAIHNFSQKPGFQQTMERQEFGDLMGDAEYGRAAYIKHFTAEIDNLFKDRSLSAGRIEDLWKDVDKNPYDKFTDPQADDLLKENIPPIYYEMLQGVKVIADMDKHDSKLDDFLEAINARIITANGQIPKVLPKLFIAGEGSSIAIPGQIAESLADQYDISDVRIVSKCCGEVKKISDNDIVVVISNSGETDTAIKLAERARAAGALVLGITRNGDSELANTCGKKNTLVLNCGKEKEVGATKSVVEQSLVISSLIERVAMGGEDAGSIHYDDIAETYKKALTSEIPREIIYQISRARELVIIGGEGVHREAALKVAETIGKKVRIIDRPFGLHGDEETFSPEDAVLFLDPYPDKIADIEERFINKRKKERKGAVPVFYLTSDESVKKLVPNADKRVMMVPESDDCQPIMNLGVIQKMLVDIAVYQGKNCRPQFAQKVGDPFNETVSPA